MDREDTRTAGEGPSGGPTEGVAMVAIDEAATSTSHPPNGSAPGASGGPEQAASAALAPPAGGFGSPGEGFAPPPRSEPQVHPCAFLSIVCGIATIPSCCCWLSGLPLAIAGIVFGVIALRKIRHHPDRWKGQSLAIAGIVCSSIGIASSASALFFPAQWSHIFE